MLKISKIILLPSIAFLLCLGIVLAADVTISGKVIGFKSGMNSTDSATVGVNTINGSSEAVGDYSGIQSPTLSAIVEPTYSNFTADTTDFSNVANVSNVTNLTLATTHGKIKFSESYGINADGEDYDANIEIGDGFVYVNTNALDTTFNNSAVLTFNNVDCNKPSVFYSESANTFAAILAENQRCYAPLCTDIQCNAGTLTVNVSHFTGFAAGADANLTINAEAGTKYENDSIEFTAEYINSTDGTPISGTCNITFNNGASWDSMDFNTPIYNFSRSFLTSGTKSYNVSCAGAGYVSLEANDTKYVTPSGGAVPEFSIFTLGLGLIIILVGLFIIRKKR